MVLNKPATVPFVGPEELHQDIEDLVCHLHGKLPIPAKRVVVGGLEVAKHHVEFRLEEPVKDLLNGCFSGLEPTS